MRVEAEQNRVVSSKVAAWTACACWLWAAVPAEKAPPSPSVPKGVKAYRELIYARASGRDLRLDLYVPERARRPVPVVLYIHGGAWRGGFKERTPVIRLLTRGYAGASINYRFSQEAVFPAQIFDSKAAVRWLRAHAPEYNLDSNRIAVWGASAGGHLAALLGTSGGVKDLEGDLGNRRYSSRVQAVVDFFGPTDFAQMDAQAGVSRHNLPDSPESRLIGGPLQRNRDKAALANPITYVTRDDPPFLILHGDKDPIVPSQQSELLYKSLRRAKVEATLHLVKGAGHGLQGPEIDRMVDEFLDNHLKVGPAADPH